MVADNQNQGIATNEKSCKLITEENVLKVLRRDIGPDAIFKSFNVEDFTAKGDNFSSFVTSIEIKYTVKGNAVSSKYVAKINPKRFSSDTDLFIHTQFEQENKFYSKIIPEMNEILEANHQAPIRVPKFYHYSDEAGSEILYLEDMRERGFKLYDRLKGVDEVHAELVFKELGRLHCAGKMLIERYGEQEAIAKFGLMDDVMHAAVNKEMLYGFFSAMMVTGSKLTKSLGPKYQRAAQVLLEMSPDLDKIVGKLLEPRQPFATIQHGDCWNNNILFRYENGKPVEVCLLDLQMVRYSSLAIDLNYFTHASFNGPVRQKGIDGFLDIYYDAYKGCLPAGKKAPFTQQDLRTEYDSKKKFGMIMNIVLLPFFVATADFIPNFDIPEEEMEITEEQREKTRMEALRKNPAFQGRFVDMIDEMIAAGILA